MFTEDLNPLLKSYKCKDEVQLMNRTTYFDYLNRFQNLAINMFKWDNLPETVSERFLEKTLCNYGVAVFFRDELLGDLALTVQLGDELDVYGIPTRRRAYSVANRYRFGDLNSSNSVLIYNNYLHTRTIDTILLYAKRISEIERAMDVNIKLQKLPAIITCDESQKLTINNVLAKWQENYPVILGVKDWGIHEDMIKALKIDAPFISLELQKLKSQKLAELYSFLGVENFESDKKERLVTDEVGVNMGAIMAQRYIMLNARREAAEQINKMFGLNISVKFRDDVTLTTTDDTGNEPEGRETEDAELLN